MPKITNEDIIIEKLNYIGLDLKNIPEFLRNPRILEYRPLKVYEENVYKVYKHIPISKIDIMLTPQNRLNTIKEKYSSASSIAVYLNPEKEEDIIKHATFLKMVKEVKLEEIQKVENEQKKLNKQLPFKVKFEGNYLWQVYHSDISDKYFMLVPTEDLEYASFFYLLKKQIEYEKTKKDEMIFVPVSHENYSGKYLKQSELTDIEKYLWYFTKNWSSIYEVHDKKGNLTIQIVGDTIVYEKILSPYCVKLKSVEEANKFYKLLKALFIMATEISRYYKFDIKLDKEGSLGFEQNGKKIEYDSLISLLNKEYGKAKKQIIELEEEKLKLEENLEGLKLVSNRKDEEYLQKERKIATYLEYRKTFLGRIRYFLKVKKKQKEDKMIELDTNRRKKREKSRN